jgi:hypothetical protein
MSNVIKKCPKDGIVYDATFTGNCASCFGPLKFFCKTHNEWLDDANCPKCAGQAVPAPAAQPVTSGPSLVGVLAVLAICVGVFVAAGWFLYRMAVQKPKPATPVMSAPPVAPQEPAPPAVVTLTLAQLLADADQYVGKQVRTAGSIQFRDASRETFDLRDGTRIITVQYRELPAATKTVIAGTGADRPLSVTGMLQRDESDNSYFVVARSVGAP